MKNVTMYGLGLLLSVSMSLSAMVVESRCDDEEYIKMESGTYTDDYLFLGNELNFSGKAQDLVFLGKTLTFSGKSELGLIALGKKILYSGESGNGVITAGVNVVIDGTVTGNSYTAGKTFELTENGNVDGTLFIGCSKGKIDGPINGDLYVGAGEIVINSVITGNVKAYCGRIIIGDKGMIKGNLTYGSKERLSVEEAAKVTGTVTRDKNYKTDFDGVFPAKLKNALQATAGIFMFISFAIIGCLLLFLPVATKLNAPQAEHTFWYTALWGLLPLLMYPALVLLSIVLVVTIPFAVILLLSFFPLLFVAYLIGTTLAGKYIVTKLKWNITKRHNQFLIGALAGGLLSLIPFINFLAFILLSALGFGTYLTFIFGKDFMVEKEKESVPLIDVEA